MDDIDRQLLIQLQKEIPLQARPFDVISRKLGIDDAEVMLRMTRLEETQEIHPIGGVFDAACMGYQSTLVAMQVPEESVDPAGEIISRHPGVSICTKRRGGELNLWFVLALPPQEPLEEHVEWLRESVGAPKAFILRTLKRYKPVEKLKSENQPAVLNEREIQTVRILQEDFPVTDQPYQKLARPAGWTEEFLLNEARKLQKRGFLKRMAAINWRRKKSAESAIVMWQVPEEKADAAAAQIIKFSEVRFCEKRFSYAEWPYTLYALLEGVSEGDCGTFLRKIELRIGGWPSQCSFKENDYKKERLKYFSKELENLLHNSVQS